MAKRLRDDIERLSADYESVTGQPFRYFFCPILHRDEDVELCRGHVLNKALPEASRRWIPQRKDVDAFFGSHFESKWVDLVHYREELAGSPADILLDPERARRYRPTITRDGEVVGHYLPTGPVPASHVHLRPDNRRSCPDLVLKISPTELLESVSSTWEIRVDGDYRLPSFVSLLKAAHLTLFEMLGYRYALSPAGYFLGRTILGAFVDNCAGKKSPSIQAAALQHFHEIRHSVRLILRGSVDVQGTLRDRCLYLCFSGRSLPWAFVVLVRAADSLHAVLVPTFQAPGLIHQFFAFLNGQDEEIEMHRGRFVDGAWQCDPASITRTWPKRGVMFPSDWEART